ncbi:GNAT family N-acetyltransferase [Mycetohabitans endofungorum]|uniref:GNAT family N-acetyltransferase n=1 Tax=Mycetohabitans endofungorum TaxID=417203 RepID=UPI0030CE58BD
MIDVARYITKNADSWDKFVDESKNGTFLFKRGYMDYHAMRFRDHSLIVHDTKGNMLALLPADEKDGVLRTHGGLTYGGLVTLPSMKTVRLLKVFDAICEYARVQGFDRILYKTIPSIYHRIPAEEDRYALFLNGAKLIRRDVLSVVLQADQNPFAQHCQRKVRMAREHRMVIAEDDKFSVYWPMLTDILLARHGVTPTHSLSEIQLLRERFPESIKLHTCFEGSEMLAGIVMYLSGNVAHAQYIGANPRGRKLGALDLLFTDLIDNTYRNYPYFDFGISTENNGYYLNASLIRHKEKFGARAVVQDCYEVEIARF